MTTHAQAPVTLADEGRLDLGSQALEYRMIGPRPDEAPTIVLLHEGLGCVGLWRDFPDRLAAATGFGVFAYSRAGYGRSSPASLPRSIGYLHEEAERVLPQVLDAIGLRRGIFLGHSDGASIAAIHLGRRRDARMEGAMLVAPHFVVEDVTVAGIRAARTAYETGDLRARLARWHAHVDVAFRGWCDTWLEPGFREWDIRELLPDIAVPLHVVQGENDEYATLHQVELALALCGVPVETTVLPGIGHSPHREAADRLLALARGFAQDRLGVTGSP